MKHQHKTKINLYRIIGVVSGLFFLACAQQDPHSQGKIPASWYTENFTETTDDPSSAKYPLAASFKKMIEADGSSINVAVQDSSPGIWRVEEFLTSFSVSTNGFLARLFNKGTPSFTLVWRNDSYDYPDLK